MMKLPDVETVAAKAHQSWVKSKPAHGIGGLTSEAGEDLMVSYERLSERAKELRRETVKAVYAAIGNTEASVREPSRQACRLLSRR